MLDISFLNDAQKEAVLCTEGPLVVLAGAGCGKTGVLTYRIAHLVEDLGVYPYNILAVTFTNKAAREMRERLEKLMPSSTYGMWVYTFHSMCVRVLRQNAEILNFENNFTIYDAQDSKQLIKDIMSELNYDPKRYSPAAIASQISTAKNKLIGPSEFEKSADDFFKKAASRVYANLQQRLKRANAMDFDDLLFNAYLLLSKHSDIARAYGKKFCYILVDEFQDTNHAQYAIVELLAREHRNLMVVGDDDQSIYSWRGADIRNILDFEHAWPDATMVKLEQNYRSTSTILDAANAVIAHNDKRKAKTLFTKDDVGDKVSVYLATDEKDEGRWIAGQIERLHDAGQSYNNMAVIYRINALSRVLEDMFLRAGVPYRIVRGTRFFDRAEIRDVIAYLKLAINPGDDIAARRIINTPRRGLGKVSIELIASTARMRSISFFEAAREVSLDPACRTSMRKSLAAFVAIIDKAHMYAGKLSDIVKMIVEKSGLVAALEAQNTSEAKGRIENIYEFYSVVDEYVETHPFVPDETDVLNEDIDETDDEEMTLPLHKPTLVDFMEWVSLRTDLDTLNESLDDFVTLMTVHSAKGLEFDNVFVAGLEESIFPHQSSVLEHGVQEERRLAYVAITRARKRLFLTYAQLRHLFGHVQANACSRFISEIPDELIEHVGIGSSGMSGTGWEKRGDRHGIFGSGRGEKMYGGHVFGKKTTKKTGDTSAARCDYDVALQIGDIVEHKTFGRGKVLDIDADKLSIYFNKSGQTKKLLKGYAPIVKIE